MTPVPEAPDPTYPHDYRVIAAGTDVKPTIVGGQAINVWAIRYLEPAEHQNLCKKYGSGDMDVLDGPKVVEFLSGLPNWKVDKIPMFAFGDGRAAIARSTTPDGRKLLVEVIKNVSGLDPADLDATDVLEIGGTQYQVLDPIALLKSKATNVLKYDQQQRHDAEHLRIIARVVPLYLEEAHSFGLKSEAAASAAAKTFSRAFAVLTNPKLCAGIQAVGVDPSVLMPPQFANSQIASIANAYKWQMPRVVRAIPSDGARSKRAE